MARAERAVNNMEIRVNIFSLAQRRFEALMRRDRDCCGSVHRDVCRGGGNFLRGRQGAAIFSQPLRGAAATR